jgi:hypothetical protein
VVAELRAHDRFRGDRTVVARKPRDERLEVSRAQPSGFHQPVEHQLLRQAPHADQPVDHHAAAIEPQRARAVHADRHHAEIDAFGEAPVEGHLHAAMRAARRDGGEVAAIVPHRLLELVRVRIGEEHPRKVGFHRAHLLRALGIGRGALEERDLPRERGLGRPGMAARVRGVRERSHGSRLAYGSAGALDSHQPARRDARENEKLDARRPAIRGAPREGAGASVMTPGDIPVLVHHASRARARVEAAP